MDESGAITAGFNQAYNAAMSDMDNAITTSVVDGHPDHNQIVHDHEQPLYNTWSNTNINNCDLRSRVGLGTGSTEYDDVVTTHTHDKEDYPHTYVDLTDKVRLQEYYQNAGATQEIGLKSEYYINDDMEMCHAQTDSHPHTYINDRERTNQGLTQRHDYELISYHKPNATQDEESTSNGIIIISFLSIILDQCCYFYASAPHNESNCIPQGQELSLECIIHNPRDSFTNFSVRWFRSSDTLSALAEDIADIQSTEYVLYNLTPKMTILQRSCTQGRLYADTFVLIINHFTTDKNGYYWCQILINDSFTQPSQYAWFYADNNACLREDPYFTYVPDQAQCALIVTGM